MVEGVADTSMIVVRISKIYVGPADREAAAANAEITSAIYHRAVDIADPEVKLRRRIQVCSTGIATSTTLEKSVIAGLGLVERRGAEEPVIGVGWPRANHQIPGLNASSDFEGCTRCGQADADIPIRSHDHAVIVIDPESNINQRVQICPPRAGACRLLEQRVISWLRVIQSTGADESELARAGAGRPGADGQRTGLDSPGNVQRLDRGDGTDSNLPIGRVDRQAAIAMRVVQRQARPAGLRIPGVRARAQRYRPSW